MADLANAAPGHIDLIGDGDAAHWAERFASMFEVRRAGECDCVTPPDTEALMLTWFAGAIETGHISAERGRTR